MIEAIGAEVIEIEDGRINEIRDYHLKNSLMSVAVADACEAMMSPRAYREALSADQVEAQLNDGAGRRWDPAVVEAFRACKTDLYAIRQPGMDAGSDLSSSRCA